MLLLKLVTAVSLRRSTLQHCNSYHCWIAGIAKIGRNVYEAQHNVTLVNPDGSSIHSKYHQPIQLIVLPIDINKLSESEKQMMLMKRRPKTKIVIQDDYEDDFDETEYIK